MSGSDWIAVALGVAGIAWVNWYFLFAGRAAPAAVAAPSSAAGESPPEIDIVVDGGYAPSAVRVRAGQPVRLIFDRRDTSSCSDEVVFPDFGIRRFLPTGQRTPIEITAPRPGKFGFTCGMSMHRGTLIAE